MSEKRSAIQGVSFGRRVAEIRRAIPGMTQERLAELVGMPDVDGNTISQLEGGRKKYLPEQPLLGAIARALGVSEVSLLRDSGVITEEIGGPPEDPSPVREYVGLIRRIDWTVNDGRTRIFENILQTFLDQDRARREGK